MTTNYVLFTIHVDTNTFRAIACPMGDSGKAVKPEVSWQATGGQRPALIEQATEALGAPAKVLDWDPAKAAKILKLADEALPQEIAIESPEEKAWDSIKAIVSNPDMTPENGIKEIQAALMAMGIVKSQAEPAKTEGEVFQVQAAGNAFAKVDPVKVAPFVYQSEAYRAGLTADEASRRWKSIVKLTTGNDGGKRPVTPTAADRDWFATYRLNPLPQIQAWKAASAAYRASKASKAA